MTISVEYPWGPVCGHKSPGKMQNKTEATSLAGLSREQQNLPCAIRELYLWRDHREGGRAPIGQQSKLLQGGAMHLLLLWLSEVSHKCPKLFELLFFRKICKPPKLFCYDPKTFIWRYFFERKEALLWGFFFFLSATRNAIRPLLGTLLTAFLCQESLVVETSPQDAFSTDHSWPRARGSASENALFPLEVTSKWQELQDPRCRILSLQTWKITIYLLTHRSLQASAGTPASLWQTVADKTFCPSRIRA